MQLTQQLAAMQQTQVLQNQALMNINQQISFLGSSAINKAGAAVTYPILNDTNTFAQRSMGLAPAIWQFSQSNTNIMSREQQRDVATNLGTSTGLWATSGLKWASDISALGLALGGMSKFGPIAGVLGMGVMPVAGSYFGHAQNMMRENADMSSFFTKQSYMFSPASRLMNPYNYGMGLQDSQKFSKEMLLSNQEIFMPSDEFNKITKGLVSSGLMYGSGTDLSSFKKRLMESIKFVRSAAKILDETHDEIVNMMSDFHKLGISTANFDVEAAKLKGVATISGMSSTQVVNVVKQVVGGITGGTNINPTNALNVTQDFMAGWGNIYSRGNQQLKGYIDQNGGVGGVAASSYQSMLGMLTGSYYPMLGAMFTPDGNGNFAFNRDALTSALGSGMTTTALANKGSTMMRDWQPYQVAEFMARKNGIISSLGSQDQYGLLDLLISSSRNMPGDLGKMSDQARLVQMFGLSENQAQNMSYLEESIRSGYLSDTVNQNNTNALVIAANSASALNKPTWWEKIKYGWENIKDSAGMPMVGMANRLTNKFDKYMNRMTTIDKSDIYSVTSSTGMPLDFTATGRAAASAEYSYKMLELDKRIGNVWENNLDFQSALSLKDVNLGLFGITAAPDLSLSMGTGSKNFLASSLMNGLGDWGNVIRTSTSTTQAIKKVAGQRAASLVAEYGSNLAAFDPIAAREAAKWGMDVNKLTAIGLAESGANVNSGANSTGEAIGPMQLAPKTAAGLGVNPYDPNQNIAGGAKHLNYLLGSFGGNLGLAAVGYIGGGEMAKDVAARITGRPFSNLTSAELGAIDFSNGKYTNEMYGVFGGGASGGGYVADYVKKVTNFYTQLGGESVTQNAVTKTVKEISSDAVATQLSAYDVVSDMGLSMGTKDYENRNKLREFGARYGGTTYTTTKDEETKEVKVTVSFSKEFTRITEDLSKALESVPGSEELKNALVNNIYSKNVNDVSASDINSVLGITSKMYGAIETMNIPDAQKEALRSYVDIINTTMGETYGKSIGAATYLGYNAAGVKSDLSLPTLLAEYDNVSKILGGYGPGDFSNTEKKQEIEDNKAKAVELSRQIGEKKKDDDVKEEKIQGDQFALLNTTGSQDALAAALIKLESKEDAFFYDYITNGNQGAYGEVNELRKTQSMIRAIQHGKGGELSSSDFMRVSTAVKDQGVSGALRTIASSKLTVQQANESVVTRFGIRSSADIQSDAEKSFTESMKTGILTKEEFTQMEALAANNELHKNATLYSKVLASQDGDKYASAQANYLLKLNEGEQKDADYFRTLMGNIMDKESQALMASSSGISFEVDPTTGGVRIGKIQGVTAASQMQQLTDLGGRVSTAKGDATGQLNWVTGAILGRGADTGKMSEFSSLVSSGDEAGLNKFLEENQEYKKVMEDDRVKAARNTILGCLQISELLDAKKDLLMQGEESVKLFGKTIKEGMQYVLAIGEGAGVDEGKLKQATKSFETIASAISGITSDVTESMKSNSPAERQEEIKRRLDEWAKGNSKIISEIPTEVLNAVAEEVSKSNPKLAEAMQNFKKSIGSAEGVDTDSMVEAMTGLVASADKAKAELKEGVQGLEDSYRTAQVALDYHQRAIQTMSKTIRNEIKDLKKDYPQIELAPETGSMSAINKALYSMNAAVNRIYGITD